jgi:hypothetical protein
VVAFGRLSQNRGGTPTGEPRPKRRPVATSAGVARRNEIKLRLSAFRFPFSFRSLLPFVLSVRHCPIRHCERSEAIQTAKSIASPEKQFALRAGLLRRFRSSQ